MHGGEREIAGDDGYWIRFVESGITIPNGIGGPNYGGALHWKAPLRGLMLCACYAHMNNWSFTFVYTQVVPAGTSTGLTITTTGNYLLSKGKTPDFFGQYEKGKLMFAA